MVILLVAMVKLLFAMVKLPVAMVKLPVAMDKLLVVMVNLQVAMIQHITVNIIIMETVIFMMKMIKMFGEIKFSLIQIIVTF